MRKIDRNILLDAIKTFGVLSQLEKCSEECDELSGAIWDHFDKDNDETRFNLADELADVIITASQAVEIIELDLKWAKVLDERIKFKVERLAGLIKAEKEKAFTSEAMSHDPH